MSDLLQPLLVAALSGLAAGLGMLVRGMGAYRTAGRIADTAGSTIASIAVGEIRLTGTVEPAELLLVSALQSVPCIYYRSLVDEHEDRSERRAFSEERAVGFRLRDESGSLRIFPRGARWSIPDRFHGATGMLGEQPAGLNVRLGPALQAATLDHEAAVVRLLTVRDPHAADPGLLPLLAGGGEHRSYREARVEPGDTITIVGFVEPFDQLPDPTGADDATLSGLKLSGAIADATVAADLEAARARGELAESPEAAWGNAAIPGFGIGRPTRTPELDPEARALPIADAETAARIERTFQIEPADLIVAATPEVPLLVTLGGAAEATTRERDRFLLGLLGAVLAIGSAMLLAVLVSGALS